MRRASTNIDAGSSQLVAEESASLQICQRMSSQTLDEEVKESSLPESMVPSFGNIAGDGFVHLENRLRSNTDPSSGRRRSSIHEDLLSDKDQNMPFGYTDEVSYVLESHIGV